jgi:pimeloyl-ACP methyl ester carboxylesterase
MALKYRIEGSGKEVVLVHGFGEDSSVWVNQVEHLKGRCRLFIVDLPVRENKDEWTLPFFAEGIKEMLDKEQVPSCTMIGHSMGGYITLAFADRYPEMLNAFGLFHSSAFADSEEKIKTRKKGIKFIRENGPAPFLETMIPNLFSDHSRESMPDIVNKAKEVRHNFSGPALVRYYEAMIERPDHTGVLKKSKVPVLFIMGKYDTAVPVEDGLKQCHLPENAYIHILRRSGHMGMLEEKESANLALDKFLWIN